MNSKLINQRLILIILDGYGYDSINSINQIDQQKSNQFNAIIQAKTPFIDSIENNLISLIDSSSHAVGLPHNQMGNSEVGHLNLGAGRIVYQDIVRINKAIESGEFKQNSLLIENLTKLTQSKKNLHIIGLCSEGGVHSHQNHLLALIKLANQYEINQIYLHLILDGRDVPPKSAESSINLFENYCKKIKQVKIASLIGRYYAMDRDKRWDRLEKAYQLITEAKAFDNFIYKNATQALKAAYLRGESDEFTQASLIGDYQGVQNDDLIVFMNFRADRARQLTASFIDPEFNHFLTKKIKLQQFITLTQYQKDFNCPVIFEPYILNNTLGEVLEKRNKKQLRIAETEKYAHVTYFFSGGREDLFKGEERKLIDSPKVATYDLKPEMSAYKLTNSLIKYLNSQKYDFIVCNFANPDMVGHTGNLKATIKAIEVIDDCLAKIVPIAKKNNYQVLITADHGNAEKMYDYKTKQAHTAHTENKVPLYYLGQGHYKFKKKGKLANISPTILDLMKIGKPTEMTEESLINE